MSKPNIKYIDRELVESPYCIGLCLDEDNFKREMKRLGVPCEKWPDWVKPGSDGTVHYFEKERPHSSFCAIVCIKKRKGLVYNQVIGLIVHEAVHVWQVICKHISEDEPSKEFEAYSIQTIAQRLIAIYDDLMKAGYNRSRGKIDGKRKISGKKP
jgi:hypothetical protein